MRLCLSLARPCGEEEKEEAVRWAGQGEDAQKGAGEMVRGTPLLPDATHCPCSPEGYSSKLLHEYHRHTGP